MKNAIPEKYWKCVAVYVITHEKHGVVYVGASNNVYRRYRQHLSGMENNNHPNTVLFEYLKQVNYRQLTMSIYRLCNDLSNLKKMEDAAIKKLKPITNSLNSTVASLRKRSDLNLFPSTVIGQRSKKIPLDINNTLKHLGLSIEPVFQISDDTEETIGSLKLKRA